MSKEETTSYYSDIDWLHLYADGTASVYHSSCGCCEQEEKIGTTKELLDYIDEEIKNLTELRNSIIRKEKAVEHPDYLKPLVDCDSLIERFDVPVNTEGPIDWPEAVTEQCGTVGCTYCDPDNYDGWEDEDCSRQQVEADAKQCPVARGHHARDL